MSACPNCLQPVAKGEDICENCGAFISTIVTQPRAAVAVLPLRSVCPACNKPLRAGEDICQHCGIVLSSITASTTIVQLPKTESVSVAATGECPRCHRKRKLGARFCNGCGLRYNENADLKAGSNQEKASAAEAPILKPGDVLNNKYKIIQTIGEGGMGAVFLAEDQLLKRKVVIKTLLSTTDRDLIAQSIKEREFLAALKHTNIVAIYDFVTVEAQGYIVMEYVEGKNLEEMLGARVRPFEVAEAIKHILAILPAFVYLGKLGLVYCDFKPQNVMLEVLKDGTEIAKLIDLGTVIKHEPNPPEVYGTNGYYASEAVKNPSPETDLYSICRVLAFLVTEMDLARPFFGIPQITDYKAFQEHPIFHRLLVKGTHKDPKQRFHSASELSDQLRGVLRQIEGDQFDQQTHSRLFTSHLLITTGRLGRRGETALDEDDPTIDLLRSGDRALQQGDYATASDLYTQAYHKNARSIDAQLRLAEILLEQGELDKAFTTISTAQTIDARHWKLIWMQARLAEARNRTNIAIDFYTRLCNELPGELPPQQALARLYIWQGQHVLAEKLNRNILKADPLNGEALLNGAHAFMSQDRWPEAAKLLEQVPEESARYVDARLLLYNIYIEQSWSLKQNWITGTQWMECALIVLQNLERKTNEPRYYLTCGDFYRLLWQEKRSGSLPAGITIPGIKKIKSRDLRALAEKNYSRYLQMEPHSANRMEIINKKQEVAPWRLI